MGKARTKQSTPRQVRQQDFDQNPEKFVRETRSGAIRIVDENGRERAFVARPRLNKDGTVDLG